MVSYDKKVAKFLPLLKHLKSANAKERKKLIKRLEPEVINLISDCVLNCLHNRGALAGNLNSQQKAVVGKHSKDLADFVRSRRKKRIFNQIGSGPWLIPIISAAIPFLSSLVTGK